MSTTAPNRWVALNGVFKGRVVLGELRLQVRGHLGHSIRLLTWGYSGRTLGETQSRGGGRLPGSDMPAR